MTKLVHWLHVDMRSLGDPRCLVPPCPSIPTLGRPTWSSASKRCGSPACPPAPSRPRSPPRASPVATARSSAGCGARTSASRAPGPAGPPLHVSPTRARGRPRRPSWLRRRRVSILDVRDGVCRWIAGDPRLDPTACGHPADLGSPYCPAHRTVAPRSREAAYVPAFRKAA
ncbi:hypothetical protein FV230_12945 [Methylobacterium sp. WL6]|nr:hypothetical protein FV230_12945 [Methylobacterium sp. WL6]